ncbi:hypothetical protein ACWGA0_07305 [Streptomyces erythrochromogenes]
MNGSSELWPPGTTGPPAACRLLAPEMRGQLEQDRKKTCGEAMGEEELPQAGAVRTTEVYGRQAMLRLVGDALFLSQFSGGWKVVAAGCTPQGGTAALPVRAERRLRMRFLFVTCLVVVVGGLGYFIAIGAMQR